MKLRFLALLITIFAVWGIPYSALAGVSVDLTEPGIGARVIGLGGAFLSMSDDANAVFVNPAGLEQLMTWQAYSTMRSTPLNRGTVLTVSSVLQPGSWGNIGVGVITANVPSGFETFRDENGQIQSTGQPISFQSNVAVIAYSFDISRIIYTTSLGHLYFGGNFKLFNQKFSGALNSSGGTGFNMDFSILMKPNDRVKGGFVAKNIWPSNLGGSLNYKSGASDTLPTIYQAGIGYAIMPQLWGMLDVRIPVSKPITYNAGMEWADEKGLRLRTGIQQDVMATGVDLAVITNFTAGIGYQWKDLRFDYAYRHDSTLQENSGHFFSIGLAGVDNLFNGAGAVPSVIPTF